MTAQARAALAALMGAEALGLTDNVEFTDPKVCRNFLCGLCPHTRFTNTKMDLGECPLIHSNKLKEEYEKAVASGKDLGYEWEWERALERFVNDCDRKVVANRRRIEKQPENPVAVQLMREIQDLEQEIATLMAAVEQLGEEGKVNESMEALKNVEGVKARKADLEVKLKTATGGDIGQHQKLKVCETCSAYLSVHDSDSRLADHFGGKMHLGYKEIRDKLEELKSKSRDRPPSAPSGYPDSLDYDSRGYTGRGGYGDRCGDRYGGGGRGGYGAGRGAGYRGGYGRGGYDRDFRGGGGDRYGPREDRRYSRDSRRDSYRSRSQSPDRRTGGKRY